MKGPAEHNWGLSIDHGAWKGDWDNAAFQKRRNSDSDFQRHEQEWRAQREGNHVCTLKTANPEVPCILSGAFHDRYANTYHVTQATHTRIHLESTEMLWDPVDAELKGTFLNVKFSNAKTNLTAIAASDCGS